MSRSIFAIGPLALLAACAGGGAGGRPVLEPPGLGRTQVKALAETERMLLRGDRALGRRIDELLAEDPRFGPWLAKAFVGHAVQGYAALLENGVLPEALLGEGRRGRGLEQSLFFRARTALVRLGAPARRAIVVYLLRDARSVNRRAGRLLLRGFETGELLPALERELAEGNARSRREVLLLLGELPPDRRAAAILERAARARDWAVRGTALVPLARQWRGLGRDPRAAGAFFDRFARDPDPFVRAEALLAIGELGDPSRVRPLLATLEHALERGDERLAEAAGRALERLTGRRFGTKVRAWRAWLGR